MSLRIQILLQPKLIKKKLKTVQFVLGFFIFYQFIFFKKLTLKMKRRL